MKQVLPLFPVAHDESALLEAPFGFRPIDLAFSEFVLRLAGCSEDWLGWVSGFLSWQTGQQHSCILNQEVEDNAPKGLLPVDWLAQMQAFGVLGDEIESHRPIILSLGKLYMQRYWVYERTLVGHIKRIESTAAQINAVKAKQGLEQGFATSARAISSSATSSNAKPSNDSFDWQKNAVALSLIKPFCVISGGPGTGKTTTVARLIQSMQMYGMKVRGKGFRIKLAAPTGKAAARLTQSLTASMPEQAVTDKWFFPCVTLHNLMGVRGRSGGFVHTEQNPLHLDMLIIDEASMVDLAMMTKVLSAIPNGARVLLLGDTNQLSSVDVGNVLADICLAPQALIYSDNVRQQLSQLLSQEIPNVIVPYSPSEHIGVEQVNDRVAWLHKSYRFSQDSQVGKLAQGFLQGDYAFTKQLMLDAQMPHIQWQREQNLGRLLQDMTFALKGYFNLVKQGDIEGSLQSLGQFQVLAAQRKGLFGVENINSAFEQTLYQQGMLQDDSAGYAGKPVMITRNAPSIGLFNGDVGIFMPAPENSSMLKIWFMIQGELRGFLPARVPEYETAYCITVHKSQGSEYEQVILCLNTSATGYVKTTRELLYTGLTRSKKRFYLYASERALQLSLAQRIRRASGLADAVQSNIDV